MLGAEMTDEFDCGTEEDDNITHVQHVDNSDGTTTVVVGCARPDGIRQHVIGSLSARLLDAFERDVATAVDRREDPEPTIMAWAAVEDD
jgi:hypothetical protein